MTLSPAVINDSFERAKNENGGLDALGLRFYERLFEKYPGVKPLFSSAPEDQQKKLMASISAIVASVSKPDVMLPYLRAMGVRHNAYKVESDHYGAVAENLLSVLSEHLSKEGQWTEEMKSNWQEALTIISDVMIDAQNHPEKYADEMATAGYLTDGFKQGNNKPWELVSP